MPVGESGAAERVADDDKPFTEHPVHGQDHGRVDVDAVADQLRPGTGGKGRAHKPRIPVVEGRHAVEKMGGVGGAGGKTGHGSVKVRGAVAQRHSADLRGFTDKFRHALQLGGHGDEAYLPAAELVQAVEQVDIRQTQILRRLCAPLLIGEEGPLQVYPRAFGPVCRPFIAPDVVHHLHQRRLRDGHGGEAEGGDAVAAIVPGEGGDLLCRAVAGIQPGGTVSVYIDKAGDNVSPLDIDARARREAGYGL